MTNRSKEYLRRHVMEGGFNFEYKFKIPLKINSNVYVFVHKSVRFVKNNWRKCQERSKRTNTAAFAFRNFNFSISHFFFSNLHYVCCCYCLHAVVLNHENAVRPAQTSAHHLATPHMAAPHTPHACTRRQRSSMLLNRIKSCRSL